ncbi:MAG: alkaline phosphatase D family protein [Vicinamibacterales bacterium]
MNRRTFLQRAAGSLGAAAAPLHHGVFGQAPAVVTADRQRPRVDYGVAAGDPASGRALVWAHADRPSRLVVEYATSDTFAAARRVRGPLATPDTGLTARVALDGLAPGQDVFYRVRFEDPDDPRILSAPETGHFRTAPVAGRPVRLAWSADTCGQGWGIDTARGGMGLFRTMREAEPDLFLNLGDTIYADQPLRETVTLDDGGVWRNLMTPAKAKVAETLDEFRGAHLYNRLDEHYRRFAAEVGQVTLWDDHEVRDNWYPTQVLGARAPYEEKRVSVLAARARRAFLEHYPVSLDAGADTRIYRTVPFGPLVEVFALDMRSYRGANSANLQEAPSPETAFMGSAQVQWLADALARSSATWKVIAADMPLGLVVGHQEGFHEAVANGDAGPPRGRELEIAGLLRTLKQRGVRNVIWITADVHYCAAHHYDPARASVGDFDPFWEFVAGPAHAGTFAPVPLDGTFGPEVRFSGVPPDLPPNRPPSAGLQFFGLIEAEPRTRVLTVSLANSAGTRIFTTNLEPALRSVGVVVRQVNHEGHEACLVAAHEGDEGGRGTASGVGLRRAAADLKSRKPSGPQACKSASRQVRASHTNTPRRARRGLVAAHEGVEGRYGVRCRDPAGPQASKPASPQARKPPSPQAPKPTSLQTLEPKSQAPSPLRHVFV